MLEYPNTTDYALARRIIEDPEQYPGFFRHALEVVESFDMHAQVRDCVLLRIRTYGHRHCF